MNDSSRTQGGLICIGVVIVGAWYLLAVLQGSYWALAIPVSIIVFFVLGLTFWIGYTIATIRVEPAEDFDETAAPNAPDTDAKPSDAANSTGSSAGDAAG
jgi:cell division protein FtsN